MLQFLKNLFGMKKVQLQNDLNQGEARAKDINSTIEKELQALEAAGGLQWNNIVKQFFNEEALIDEKYTNAAQSVSRLVFYLMVRARNLETKVKELEAKLASKV